MCLPKHLIIKELSYAHTQHLPGLDPVVLADYGADFALKLFFDHDVLPQQLHGYPLPQHFLYFFPDPHGQESFGPTFGTLMAAMAAFSTFESTSIRAAS